MTYEKAIELTNIVGLVIFICLLMVALAYLFWRLVFYVLTDRWPSIIFRRDLALILALALVAGSALLIRAFGWAPALREPGLLRLAYVLATTVGVNVALGYWVWAEVFVIGRPGKVNE